MHEIDILKQEIETLKRELKLSKESLYQYESVKKKYQEALHSLKKQKHFTESIIESSQNGIIAINQNQKVVVYNSRAQEIFGWSKKEMLNKNSLKKIIPPDALALHEKAVSEFMKTKKSNAILNNTLELEAIKKDGTLFPVRISFGVDLERDEIIVVASIDDITEELHQQKIIKQQENLALIGEMIGVIAHQWRQPLNAISIRIQSLEFDFLEGKLQDKKFIDEFIQKNKKTIQFMSKTIDDFRNFFREDKQKVFFDLKKETLSVINMLDGQFKSYNIEVKIEGDGFEFLGYPSKYQQVVLNILSNAKDIFVERGIQNREIVVKFLENRVEICDNGGGIEQENLPKVFDPYFTTKQRGLGTGMGLYISHTIIEEMGGFLGVKNQDDGTCFFIDFKEEMK